MAQALRGDADLECLYIDSTIVRAHLHSAGAEKSRGQEIGRSRGGLTTTLHVVVDALGNPLRVILSGGQLSDIDYAAQLIERLPAQAVIAKGYDSNHFVAMIEAAGAKSVIPPRSDRLASKKP